MATLDDLEARNRADEAEARRLQREVTARERLMDTIHRGERPAFPTDEHRSGIAEACSRIRLGQRPADSHGDRCSASVQLGLGPGGALRIGLDHDAPFSHRHTGGKLWRFTDDEAAEFVALIMAEGLEIIDHWHHDNGLSVTVTLPTREN